MRIRLKLNSAFRLPPRAPGDRRLWLLGALAIRREEHARPVWHFEVFWKRLAALCAVLAIGSYLIAAAALWFWLQRVPENKVRLTTVLLAPVQWSRFRQERGDTDIAVALARLQDRQFGEAYFGLRAGLARSPGNVEGRVTLALLLAGNDPRQAMTVIEDGLSGGGETQPQLLRTLFGLYQLQGAKSRAGEQIERLLGRRPPLPPAALAVVAAERAAELAAAGDDAAVEALLAPLASTGDPRSDARVAMQRVNALTRLGRTREAEAIAKALGDSAISFELVRAQAEAAIHRNDSAALEGALRRLKGLAGDRTVTHLYVFQAWHRMKRLTLRDLAEREFYAAFANNDAALQAFGAMAVQLNLPEVLRRTREVAKSARLSPFAFNVHASELALRNGDFNEALRLLREWENLVDTLSPAQRAHPELIRRLTRATVAGGAQQTVALVSHLNSMRGRVSVGTYDMMIAALERAGNLDAARQVAQLGARFFPFTDALLAADERLSRTAVAATPKAAPVARAGADLELPADADSTVRQLDGFLAEENYTRARDLLRAVRSANPSWLPSADRQLALRELQLVVLTQDPFASRVLVRAHLTRYRNPEDARRVIALAQDLVARKRVSEARLLHDELAQVHAGSPEIVAELRTIVLPDDLGDNMQTAAAALAVIDKALARNQPAEALRALDYVRKQRPAWLGANQHEVLVREVRIRLASDQRPLALTTFKEVVTRPGLSRAAGFRLVRELVSEGDSERANMLAREIVRLLPDDASAKKLLKETEAPRPVE